MLYYSSIRWQFRATLPNGKENKKKLHPYRESEITLAQHPQIYNQSNARDPRCIMSARRTAADGARAAQFGAAGLGLRDPRVRQQDGAADSRRPLRPAHAQDDQHLHEQEVDQDRVQGPPLRVRRLLHQARHRHHDAELQRSPRRGQP